MDSTIRFWKTDNGNLLKTFTTHTDFISSLRYSPNGKTLAAVCGDGSICFCDADTGKLLKTITGHTFLANSVAFSPNGKTLVSSEMADSTIPLRDVLTGEL